MAWRRPGDKPLSETRMGSLLTHICVTRPQWVNKFYNIEIYLHFSPIRESAQIGNVSPWMTRTYICLAQYVLTLNMLNCFKDYLKCIRISYQSCILFNRRRLNSQWSKPTCCLSYTDNTVPADGPATLGARASAGIVLTSKAKIFHLEHQKSWCKSDITPLLMHWSFVSFFFF